MHAHEPGVEELSWCSWAEEEEEEEEGRGGRRRQGTHKLANAEVSDGQQGPG